MRASAGCLRFRLEIDNVGHAVADDLRILMVFPRTAGFKLIPETDLPKRPASHVDLFVPSRFVADRSRYDRIEVSSAEEGQTTVSIKLGKLHAGASLLTKYLYLTLPPTSPFTAQVGIYCDQFSAPISATLRFQVSAEESPLSLDDILRAERDHLMR